jgi:hypothetical protein
MVSASPNAVVDSLIDDGLSMMGLFNISPYEGENEINHTLNGDYTYTWTYSLTNQPSATAETTFTLTLDYKCFDPDNLVLNNNGFPTAITALKT